MNKELNFIINNTQTKLNINQGTVLIDVIRDELDLKGTKEGCREGDCGSCIVLHGKLEDRLMKYQIINSCMFPAGEIDNSHIVTIEGLNTEKLTPFQQILVEKGGTQCGFCTPGFVISTIGYFIQAEKLNIDDAIAFLSGNICRCTGYASIIRALESTINLLNSSEFEKSLNNNRIDYLVENNFLPDYFTNIKSKLTQSSTENKKEYSGQLIIAGGTDLYVQNENKVLESELFFVSKDSKYKEIIIEDNKCFVGGASTVTELEKSKIFNSVLPEFNEYVKLISCPSIRNRATVGGNIINASPIGDLSIIFLALNSTVVLKSESTSRQIKLKDFFLDYKKLDRKPNEIIHSIYFDLPNKDNKFLFEKVSRRTHLDIASVNCALSIFIIENIVKNIGVAAGGVAAIPKYLNETCQYLLHKELTKPNIENAIEIANSEVYPISDVRGSEEYKRLLLKQMLISKFDKIKNI